MKKTAERETSKSTLGYSGREMHAPSPGDKRYIYRPNDGRFISRPNGLSPKTIGGSRPPSFTPIISRAHRGPVVTPIIKIDLILVPAAQIEEAPDFTETDKEWIDKIDRTQLSWDEW